MKYVYTVTLELKTPWWLKFFRFLRLAKKMETFELTFDQCWYDKGDKLVVGGGDDVLIVDIRKHKQQTRCSPGC